LEVISAAVIGYEIIERRDDSLQADAVETTRNSAKVRPELTVGPLDMFVAVFVVAQLESDQCGIVSLTS
jgi:hypothetical protein